MLVINGVDVTSKPTYLLDLKPAEEKKPVVEPETPPKPKVVDSDEYHLLI